MCTAPLVALTSDDMKTRTSCFGRAQSQQLPPSPESSWWATVLVWRTWHLAVDIHNDRTDRLRAELSWDWHTSYCVQRSTSGGEASTDRVSQQRRRVIGLATEKGEGGEGSGDEERVKSCLLQVLVTP